MRILCFADTQLPSDDLKRYFDVAHKLFKQADIIIHLGDGIKQARPLLKKFPKIIYIKGNHDQSDSKAVLRQKELVLENFRCFFLHGERENKIEEQFNIWQNKLRWLIKLPPLLNNYYQELHQRFQNKYQIVVYGHLHIPKIEIVGKTVFFCPGGFSSEHLRFGHPASFGLITIPKDKKELIISTLIPDLNKNKMILTKQKRIHDKSHRT